MQYKALYRKYRPVFFSDVLGQDAIVKTLQNAIKESKISHAYLFSGPRGSGKTSVARLLAKTINCLNRKNGEPCGECEVCVQSDKGVAIDIIEIDAASNNGVEEIREIRSKVNLLPSLCQYKVYIIDEVHMLSQGAFNALLKTLEEPPKHVVFILATTEIHKLPLTIISRCQRFDFKKISAVDMIKRIKTIVEKENIEIDDEAIELIARLSDGGMRDAVGLLDQAALYATAKITESDINAIVGLVSKTDLEKMVDSVLKADAETFMERLNTHAKDGKDLKRLVEEMMILIKDMMMELNLAKDVLDSRSRQENSSRLYELLMVLNDLIYKMSESSHPKLLLEVAALNYMGNLGVVLAVEASAEELLKEVVGEKKEEKVSDKVEKESELKEKKRKSKSKLVVNEDKIAELTAIRLNNVFAGANKAELEKIKSKWFAISEYSVHQDLGVAAGLLLDAEVRAASYDHLVISYPYETVVNRSNKMLIEIEKIVNKIMGKKYKVIAILSREWENQRNEFAVKKKNNEKYQLINENIEYLIEVPEESVDEDKIVELFGDIVEIK